jgi:hypothetical protein
MTKTVILCHNCVFSELMASYKFIIRHNCYSCGEKQKEYAGMVQTEVKMTGLFV